LTDRFRTGLVFFRDAVVLFADARFVVDDRFAVDARFAVELLRAVRFDPAAARPPFRPPRRMGSRFSGLP
jgi:hypothetical protein